jgi:hypothetical protein
VDHLGREATREILSRVCCDHGNVIGIEQE